MQADHTVKRHNGIGFEQEILAVAALGFVWVVDSRFVVFRNFLALNQILRLEIEVKVFFYLLDFMLGHVKSDSLCILHSLLMLSLHFPPLYILFLFLSFQLN